MGEFFVFLFKESHLPEEKMYHSDRNPGLRKVFIEIGKIYGIMITVKNADTSLLNLERIDSNGSC